jgi:hypothetical protein
MHKYLNLEQNNWQDRQVASSICGHQVWKQEKLRCAAGRQAIFLRPATAQQQVGLL